MTGSLRHRFNQNFWVQAGLEAQKGDATDALGTVNYQLIGVPVSANFDTTDSKLDPTRGGGWMRLARAPLRARLPPLELSFAPLELA